jgi:hypothetical protein
MANGKPHSLSTSINPFKDDVWDDDEKAHHSDSSKDSPEVPDTPIQASKTHTYTFNYSASGRGVTLTSPTTQKRIYHSTSSLFTPGTPDVVLRVANDK